MDLALLDTDIPNEVLKQKSPEVIQHAAAYFQQLGRFAISSMTRHEVLRGLKEKQATAQLAKFEFFCVHTEIFAITDAIFDRASDLWASARKGGHPGKDADLIIAATALEHSRMLVTGNTVPFSWVPGLELANWRLP